MQLSSWRQGTAHNNSFKMLKSRQWGQSSRRKSSSITNQDWWCSQHVLPSCSWWERFSFFLNVLLPARLSSDPYREHPYRTFCSYPRPSNILIDFHLSVFFLCYLWLLLFSKLQPLSPWFICSRGRDRLGRVNREVLKSPNTSYAPRTRTPAPSIIYQSTSTLCAFLLLFFFFIFFFFFFFFYLYPFLLLSSNLKLSHPPLSSFQRSLLSIFHAIPMKP